MLRLQYLALAFPLFLCACLDGGSEPGHDAGPPPEPPAPELAGTYYSRSQWDLSSAITEHPGVGTVVADLIVDQVVSLSGVPSPLEDDAREKVAALIHEPIREYVDARAPSDLVPESEFLTELGAILADVETESEIELTVDADDAMLLGGRETIVAMQLRRGERSLRVPVDALALGDTSVPVEAEIFGRVVGDTGFTIDFQGFELRLDVLLARAATELLDVLDAGALGQQVAAALECAQIVEVVTGGSGSITIEVGGMSFTVALDDLLAGCELARVEVTDYALGFLNPNLGVSVGGSASATDADGDALVDSLVSGADYSGLITAVPLPTPTRFDASFMAVRTVD